MKLNISCVTIVAFFTALQTFAASPTRIEIESFLDIPFGVTFDAVKGEKVKKSSNQKLVTLKKPFRGFRKATVMFAKNGLSHRITTTCSLPSSKKTADAIAEFNAVKEILERKYNIVMRTPEMSGGRYGGGSALDRIGGNYSGVKDDSASHLKYSDSDVIIDLSRSVRKESNLASRKVEIHEITIDVHRWKIWRTYPVREGVSQKAKKVDLKGIDAL